VESVLDSSLYGDKYRLITTDVKDTEKLIKSRLNSESLSLHSLQ
jgi:hypothetical protein